MTTWSTPEIPTGGRLSGALADTLKGNASVLICAVAIALAFWSPRASCALYVVVAILWLVPDPRIERELRHPGP